MGLVILQGGTNDLATDGADGVKAAAIETIGLLAVAYPQARDLLVGPMSPALKMPGSFPSVEAAIADAAEVSGATYISPNHGEWVTARTMNNVIDRTTFDPSNEGHAYLGGRLASALLGVW